MQLNETFHQTASAAEADRLRELAIRSGLSEDEVIITAVNRMFHDVFHAGTDRPSQDLIDDLRVELAFKRRGRTVGGVTYLHAPEDFIRRASKRIEDGVPLPHEDDDSLERGLLFSTLTEEQQAQVIAAPDSLEKRRLMAGFLKA